MKLELLKTKDKEKLNFIIRESNHVFVNTLRRLIVSEVPTLAIEELDVIKNDSALFDEMLAHRLGLVPLKTDLKSYVKLEDCKCEGAGCARCQLKLTIKVAGPRTVYANDIKSTDLAVTPVYPKMVITKLLDGQELELEMTAVLGIGRQHNKFTPGLCYFQGYPIIKLKKSKNSEAIKECVAVCPTKVFSAKKDSLEIKEITDCILCMACVEEFPGLVDLESSKKDFVFRLESWGQLEPKEIIIVALELFDQKLEKLNQELKEIKT